MKPLTTKLIVFLFTALLFLTTPYTASAQSTNDGFNPNANGAVHAIVVQPDGRVIIGGAFTTISGVTRNRIARIDSNGSLDISLNPDANGSICSVALQGNGQILIGGFFTTVGGTTRNHIARLNSDGTLDLTFDPDANGIVHSIAVQGDGKILIGGQFTTVGGVTRNYIARLNSDGGLDDSFNPNPQTSATVASIVIQPDDKILIGGTFSKVCNVVRNNIARLNSDGGLDITFDPNSDSSITHIALQADGKILIGGDFTTVGGLAKNYVVRLNSDGSVDSIFNALLNDQVSSIVIQADGKILIGGDFTTVGGITRNRIARLNSDGTLDTKFNSNASSTVNPIALQADGKIIIGGNFTAIADVSRNYIARLYSDGTLDVTLYSPVFVQNNIYSIVQQTDGDIILGGAFVTVDGIARYRMAKLKNDGVLDMKFDPRPSELTKSIVVLPDKKILIGGAFTTISGVTCNRLARLHSNGSLDTSFNVGTGANNTIESIVVQSDNKILIAGRFFTVDYQSRNNIARLNGDGSLDYTFNPNANSFVLAMAIQSDDKLVVGGSFTSIGGVARNSIARLNNDSSIDLTFNPTVSGEVYAVAIQSDGKILIGGSFSAVNGIVRNNIARLNSDGSLDDTFDPNANSEVYSIVLQVNGKILISGPFATVGGESRVGIARLNSNGSLDIPFNEGSFKPDLIWIQPDGKILIVGTGIDRFSNNEAATQELNINTNGHSVIQWIRQGSAPELVRTWFEKSMDGINWQNLGTGVRIANGWELADVALSVNTNFYIRARGILQQGESATIAEFVKLFYFADSQVDHSIININNGARITATSSISLALNMIGAMKMRFMVNGGAWTAWETYNSTKTVYLPAGDGLKTVYVKFDNDATIYSDSIVLDTKVPVGTIVINNGDYATDSLNVNLTLNATDNSEITEMCISATTTCTSWEAFNTTKSFTLAGTVDVHGTKYVYAKFKDKAGKISTSASDTIQYVTTANLPPSTYTNDGTLDIKTSATYTTAIAVPIAIRNPGTYTHMKFSNNGTTWTAWEAFKTAKTYYLPAGDGKKIVYVKFKDATSELATLFGDDIVLDTKPPTGTISINNGTITTNTTSVIATLEATDINGVADMCFSTDSIHWSNWEPYATTKAVTLSGIDGTKRVSVKFRDNARKISVIYYDTIILDTKRPVGKVTINAGAAMTTSDIVTLTLYAPTSVFMQISVDGGITWGEWEPYVTTKKNVTLPSGSDTKTVSAKFKDFTGNVSLEARDTIIRQ